MADKPHPHLQGPNDSLMALARRAKAAVNYGITDEVTAFMAVFHPEKTADEVRALRMAMKEKRR